MSEEDQAELIQGATSAAEKAEKLAKSATDPVVIAQFRAVADAYRRGVQSGFGRRGCESEFNGGMGTTCPAFYDCIHTWLFVAK